MLDFLIEVFLLVARSVSHLPTVILLDWTNKSGPSIEFCKPMHLVNNTNNTFSLYM